MHGDIGRKEYVMKKKTVKVLLILGLIFVIIVIGANIFNKSTKLEMVQHGEMEKSYSFDAIVIRDETLINAQKSGVLESMVEDNEMVRKNKHVASIYESEIDDEIKKKLAHVNNRIDEITKAGDMSSEAVSGAFRIDSAIDDIITELMHAMDDKDIDKVVSIQNDLSLLSDRKNAMENGVEYTDDMLNALMAEKQSYERSLGGAKQDLFSPVSGLYSTNIDGYEEIVTPDAIGDMSPYDFDSISKMKVSAKTLTEKGSVCKIIDNFNWSVAFVATENEISKLKEGSGVYIGNSSSPIDVYGEVSYISTPTNGNYLVAVTSDVSCDWAMSERFVQIDLVKNKYKGLKVPVRALRVKDDTTGVYTVVDGIVHFKKVKVLYKDSNYAIVEENNASSGGLLLYDEVVVSTNKELKAGERLK